MATTITGNGKSFLQGGFGQPGQPAVPPVFDTIYPFWLRGQGPAGTAAWGGTGPGTVLESTNNLIVFHTGAFNFIPNDTNGVYDVYLYNCQTGQATAVSLTRFNGLLTTQPSYNAVISADGRFVAFQSHDQSLVNNQGDADNDSDIFLYNVADGSNILVSQRASDASSPVSVDNFLPVISANGNSVAFVSTAANIAGEAFSAHTAGDTSDDDIFVFNRIDRTVTQASVRNGQPASGGVATVGNAGNPDISGSGNLVVFDYAPLNLADLLTGEIVRQREVYVRDLASNSTVLLSKTNQGNLGTGGASYNPSISPNGRWVAFVSDHNDLVSGDNNGQPDIFLLDRNLGVTSLRRVSVDSAGVQANGGSWNPRVNDEGKVIFTSAASNLVPGDSNGTADIFIYDNLRRTTTRISAGDQGQQGSNDNGSFGGGGAFAFDDGVNIHVVGGNLPQCIKKTDFNGNGCNDIVYQQTSWNGANPQQAKVVYYDPCEKTWHNFVSNPNLPRFRVSAIGNFDSTDSNPEIVIYNPTTGQNFLFNPLDSVQYTATLRDPNNPDAILNTANIEPVAAGDTNGDGIDEIVYRKDAVPTGETDPTPEIAAGSNYFYDPVTRQFELINVTTNDSPLAAGQLDSDNHLEIVYGNPITGEYRVYDIVTEQFSELFCDPDQTVPGFVATGTLCTNATKPDLVIFQNITTGETVAYDISVCKFIPITNTPGWSSLA